MISTHPPARDRSLDAVITDFLTDLAHSNRSIHTQHAYAADLARFSAFYTGPVEGVTADVLRAFFATRTHLSPATRARTQAALASFLGWAYRHEAISALPMARVERVRLDPPKPRGLKREQIDAILAAIPATKQRDRLLFRLIVETGLRVGEALALYVEDLDLTRDDEHMTVVGKGNQRRTVLLDDARLVRDVRAYLVEDLDLTRDDEHMTVVGKGNQRRTVLLDDARLVRDVRAYLTRTGYTHGPLFRAEKNGRGGPLRYQSVQERWQQYCAHAGVACTLHQLRHSHATELVNAGVSLATIRKRLGHKNLQTTLRYAEQSDAAADAEMRTWQRRRRGQQV